MTDYMNCTHNCSTCSASCTPEEERKPSFFDRMEAASERFEEMGEENFINMLNEAVAALEAEDEASAETEDAQNQPEAND